MSIPGWGAITRERVLEQLLKVQNVRGVNEVLVPRLGILNATTAKGFVNELFFAADRGAVRISKQLKKDQQRDIDAILPGGEYCQLKLVSADLDYSKSLGAWLEAATREVGANKVRLVLPSGVSITQNLRDWIRQTLGFTNDDIDSGIRQWWIISGTKSCSCRSAKARTIIRVCAPKLTFAVRAN